MAFPNTAAPDFNAVQSAIGQTATGAIALIWQLVVQERQDRQVGDLNATSRIEPLTLTAAPTSNQSNVDTTGASVVHYTGSTNFDLTGFLAPDPGKTRVLIVHNSGSATITLKHAATSLTANQFSLSTGADKTLGTGKSAIFLYLASKWRDVSLV